MIGGWAWPHHNPFRKKNKGRRFVGKDFGWRNGMVGPLDFPPCQVEGSGVHRLTDQTWGRITDLGQHVETWVEGKHRQSAWVHGICMKSPQGLQPTNSSFLLVYILRRGKPTILSTYITFTKGLCFLGLKNCTGVCSAFQLCRTLSPTAAIVEDFGDTLSRTFLRVSWKQKRMVQSTQHKKLCKRKSNCNKKSSNAFSNHPFFVYPFLQAGHRSSLRPPPKRSNFPLPRRYGASWC